MPNLPKENNRGNKDLPPEQKIVRTAEAGIHANVGEPIHRGADGAPDGARTTGGVNPRT